MIPLFLARRTFAVAASTLAFPTVEGVQPTVNESLLTTHTVTLPASVAADELLLVWAKCGVDNSDTPTAITSGWTRDQVYTSHGSAALFSKTAVGGETSFQFSTGSGRRHTAIAYRISNWAEFGTTAIILNADCPSMSASWGSDKNLFIALAGALGSSTAYTAAPTGYSSLTVARNSSSALTSRCQVASAVLELEDVTSDPDSFTGGNSSHITDTLVIRGV